MNETLVKINDLLKKFNITFNVSANIKEEDGEQIVNGFKIDNLKNDGSEFVNELFNILNLIILSVSEGYELIYNEEKGLVIAKEVIVRDYDIIE
jgi:hypothetical protein